MLLVSSEENPQKSLLEVGAAYHVGGMEEAKACTQG